jgi:hypothetical protein
VGQFMPSLAEPRHAPRSAALSLLLVSPVKIACVPGEGSGIDFCGARHVGWRETQRLAGCSGPGLTQDRRGATSRPRIAPASRSWSFAGNAPARCQPRLP